MNEPLTPVDIHNVSFRRPALGKRGYDEDQVDAFLDEAEQEFTRLRAENRALREELDRAGAMPERELAALAVQLGRLSAERAEAERQARAVEAELDRARAAGAEPPATGVIAMARRTADEYLDDARREAEQLLTAARTEADRLTSDAQLRASTTDSDARHRHTQALSGLAERREEALADLDRLRLLAQAQREEIRRMVAQRLADL
ncbi:DivIVA domain-containing protein [Actinoplanes octamycinicus]|uniref:Cell wall synthesis protein Wag31 n=1 Tax=Actinoplanes octamycinicus TaxID=135948 RepID=A0A7W7GXS7_9ACTN|nr:DivIVA domain-containing protein [Actinoplanes octamycinicus]MBB4740217.1 DivIVA domain-containing protein [Actinoplanes octamycinicus]GIE59613.1 hypothetical protein Aoc01nite_50150 [Actinoplanes octamycinicus]